MIFSTIFIYIFVKLIPQIERSFKSFEVYSNFTNESLNEGIGAKLYSLPPVIRELVLIFNSQISPIPPWVKLNFDFGWASILTGALVLVFAVFWSRIFLLTFLSLLNKSFN